VDQYFKPMSDEKEEAINAYIDKRIKRFKKELKEFAIKNDYPYIDAQLIQLMLRLKENSKNKRADVRVEELKFSGWL
jgi:hypothetical protein